MVLSAATKKPSGMQRGVVCSAIGTVGVALTLFPGKSYAIATSAQINAPSLSKSNTAGFEQSEPQWNDTHLEQAADAATDAATEAASSEAEAEAAADRAGLERLRARLLSPKTTSETSASPAPNTYLYGQQPIANQPETAYFVFESQGSNITGALYMASSSFDCVKGQIVDQQIALSVTDSYSQQTYSYALTLNDPLVEVASQSSAISVPGNFVTDSPPNIDGFYPLPLQAQDRAILAVCQTI